MKSEKQIKKALQECKSGDRSFDLIKDNNIEFALGFQYALEWILKK